MEKQMVVRIREDIKKKFYKVVRMEGKTASEKIREMIEEYIRENDLSTVVDNLWERVSKKIASKGYDERDIDTAIEEARESQ